MIHIGHSAMPGFPWHDFYDLMQDEAILAPQLEDGMRPLTAGELQQYEGDPRRTVWLVHNDRTPLGFIMLARTGTVTKELHTGWRAGTARLRREVWAYVQEREFASGIATITATVPAFNRRTCHMAVAIGFRRVGVWPKSFLQNGILHDQLLYAVTKGDM